MEGATRGDWSGVRCVAEDAAWSRYNSKKDEEDLTTQLLMVRSAIPCRSNIVTGLGKTRE